MRLLFIGFNSRYINPTNSLLPAMLKMAVDVVYYGPGYTDSKVLAKGIAAFIDQHGPFDALATTMQLCAGKDPVKGVAFLHRYAVSPWSAAEGVPFVIDVSQFLKQAGNKRICFLTDLDVYALDQAMAESLQLRSDYFVGWGPGFSEDAGVLNHLAREEFYKRKVATRPIGLWHDFVSETQKTFINFGHFVGLEEFSWTSLAGRSYAVDVPGQLYARRKDILKIFLASLNKITMPNHGYRKVFSLFNKLGFKPYANPYLSAFYALKFVSGIRQSQFVYTEGSGYQRPLRKFFEIPALGCVLLCAPCAGFRELGFTDGINTVIVDEHRLLDQVRGLLDRPEQAQAIADCGRQLIWERHSLPARACQFRQCLETIIQGDFAGSFWNDGEFIVARRSAG